MTVTIEKLIKSTISYIPDINKKKLIKAYEFAKKAHKGQKRNSGEDYIIHPLETAYILSELHAEESIVTAGLLHDIPEDTKYSLKIIEETFSKEVAFLVKGVTKLSNVNYQNHEQDRRIQSLKRLLLYSAEDLRVILIKLADRLHNMRTLAAVPDIKQLRIARETMEVYIPIANLFGIRIIKDELENLCFKYLFKNKYESVINLIEKKINEYNPTVEKTIKNVKKYLTKKNIKFEIKINKKNTYSIFKKLENQKKSIPDVEDLIAITIILNDNVSECYSIMGYLHELYKPKTGKIKDNIALPKINGYQSLHTSVFGPKGSEICFQIRTRKMELEAVYGFASQYFINSENRKNKPKHLKSFYQIYWTKKIHLFQEDLRHNLNVFSNLYNDIFQDRIFTFTPKGKIVDLPKNATAIDFAYAIHTDIGNAAQSALINNIPQGIWSILQTGDTVKIITDKDQKLPKLEWLSIVKTQLARNKIKEKLKKESKESKQKIGKDYLENELNKTSKNFYQVFNYKNVQLLLSEFNFNSVNELLEAVGEGVVDPKLILDKIYLQKHHSYEEILGTSLKSDSEGRYEVIIKIIGDDRVGFLKNLLAPISNLDINILKITATTNIKKHKATIKLHIMIKEFKELSNLYEELKSVDGVESIERIVPNKLIISSILILSIISVWVMLLFGAHNTLKISNESIFILWGIILIVILINSITIYYLRKIIINNFNQLENKKYSWTLTPILSFLISGIIVNETIHHEILQISLAIPFGFFIFFLSFLFVYQFSKKDSWKRIIK